jgi:acetylornithine/N-succinyldiaminopimelate aminotransferase
MADRSHLVADAERYLVPTYGRPPFVLDRGQGVEVWDTEGRRYLDFVAGIAVNSLGHAHPAIVETIAREAPRLIHTSNLYHTAPAVELARLLAEASFADRVFFTNSGTEAVEGAFKFARKVARERHGEGKHAIVAFEGAFHGRTMGAVAATHREKYRAPYMPVMPGVRFAPLNDLDATARVIDDDVCAVIVEPVQGEGGVTPASDAFLQMLHEQCDAHGALLIVDEIQCGLGRTGELWAYTSSGIKPDIMCIAKPLGGGLPIGAILTTDAVAEHLHVGDHGSTFAGGPLVCAVALAVFKELSSSRILAHVREIGDYLGERLEEIRRDDAHVLQIRGCGLLRGVQVAGSAAAVRDAAQEAGLLLVPAGDDIIRFVPPLIIEREHVDEAIGILRHALEVLD